MNRNRRNRRRTDSFRAWGSLPVEKLLGLLERAGPRPGRRFPEGLRGPRTLRRISRGHCRPRPSGQGAVARERAGFGYAAPPGAVNPAAPARRIASTASFGARSWVVLIARMWPAPIA